MSRHCVAGVISQPDRGRGRGRRRTPSPVSAWALDQAVPLLRPERVGDAESLAFLDEQQPDLGVVIAFGQFIPKTVREQPRLGYLINAHASLLPRHRGASPIQAAILAGDQETGISVMRVEKEMDAGAVALIRETSIGDQEDTGQRTQRLGELAADAILEAVVQIADDRAIWSEQDTRRVTYAPRIEKHEGRLDWNEAAAALVRRVRALAPKPGAFTALPRIPGRAPESLKILSARAIPSPTPSALPSPGRLHRPPDDPSALWVATGDGWVALERVQRSGGRVLGIHDFLRGYPLEEGQWLGVETEAVHGQ
ncbi:methionyl-tRNA formyltransferase [Myxococcota bacterium]|nr:methionyl-tRNA formyltransferase [Myxococcota bacterium]